MPFISVKIIEDTLTLTQKQALIGALTDAVANVGGEGMRAMTRCVIEEIGSGLWGVAGKPLTTADALATANKGMTPVKGSGT